MVLNVFITHLLRSKTQKQKPLPWSAASAALVPRWLENCAHVVDGRRLPSQRPGRGQTQWAWGQDVRPVPAPSSAPPCSVPPSPRDRLRQGVGWTGCCRGAGRPWDSLLGWPGRVCRPGGRRQAGPERKPRGGAGAEPAGAGGGCPGGLSAFLQFSGTRRGQGTARSGG